jgi:hypothetical protein
MKRLMTAAGCLLLMACAGCSTQTEAESEEYSSTSAYGTIKSISGGVITITEDDQNETSIAISSITSIIKNDTIISSDELNPDDYVLVTITNGTPTIVDVLDPDSIQSGSTHDDNSSSPATAEPQS